MAAVTVAVDVEAPAARPESPLRSFLRRLRRQRAAMVALVVVALVVVAAAAAPWIAPADPLDQDLAHVLAPPSGDHLLGTDELGRDVLSRLLYGGRVSLLAAAQAVGVALVLSVVPGLVAGYAGGRTDAVVMRIADAAMSFPPLILAMAVLASLGPGLTNAMLAIGVIFAPRFIRMVRATAASVRQETYVQAAISIGVPHRRVIVAHVLPNILAPLIVQVSLALGFAMIAEASLSFLGLGAQAPQASWGSMLGRSFRFLDRTPWLIVYPGLAISVCVLAFNLLGDGVRDSLGRETAKGADRAR